ncbi:MAG: TlpA disulfide reductase family protein, partial [Planctomycetota bacterium]
MPHLNDLQAEFGDRGLTVVGVTDESKGQTEKWIEKYKADFAYAYYSGNTLKNFAQVRGIPAAMLVDASGTVVWRGHPAQLTSDIVEEHLDGALPWPLYDFPSEAKKVAKAISDNKLGAALMEARELAAEGAFDQADAVVSAVETLVESQVKQVNAAFELGDFLTVERDGSALARSLRGLAEADEVSALVGKVDGDAFAQKVIKVQE